METLFRNGDHPSSSPSPKDRLEQLRLDDLRRPQAVHPNAVGEGVRPVVPVELLRRQAHRQIVALELLQRLVVLLDVVPGTEGHQRPAVDAAEAEVDAKVVRSAVVFVS